MINKQNWQLTRTYLDYRLRVDQLCRGSLQVEETQIRYLLEWAQSQSFSKASSIRPTLPAYLVSFHLEKSDSSLSPGYIKKVLAAGRRFFTWLYDHQAGYKSIKGNWIATLKVKRLSDVPRTKEAVSFEEIKAIAAAPVETIKERRIRAAAVMLFLSGMRIGAFVSIPIQAVGIDNRTIKQFPSLGVRTKNRKHGITFLLDIPELLAVVKEWDNEIRNLLPPGGFWFSPLSPETGEIDPHVIEIGEHRVSIARKNLKEWLDKVKLPYHSPHKFRHGHIHYGLSHAQNIADFKAISQNAMHSSMDITDQFYSNQNDQEIQERIGGLGKKGCANSSDDEFKLFQQFLEWQNRLSR